jgi:hypothetical protein
MPVLPREVLMDKQYIHTQEQNKKNKFKKKPPSKGGQVLLKQKTEIKQKM